MAVIDERREALSASVEGLYRAFSSYPLPRDTNPCPCCHSEEEVSRIYARPLRELESKELRGYAFDAFFVWGDSCVFRHFLPRIYELLLRDFDLQFWGDDFLGVNVEIPLAKLRHGRWQDWPLEEQVAVRDFLHALWSYGRMQLVDVEYEYEELCDQWLCGIAQAEEVLAPYLSAWLNDPEENAIKNLAAYILRTDIADPDKRGGTGFWGDRTEQYSEVQRWLQGGEVKNLLSWAAEKNIQYAEAALAHLRSLSAYSAIKSLRTPR